MKLNDKLNQRLKHIENLVCKLWEPHKLSHYFFTPHDISHSKGVIGNLEKLIPVPSKKMIKTPLIQKNGSTYTVRHGFMILV